MLKITSAKTNDRKWPDHLAGRPAGSEKRIHWRSKQIRDVRSRIQSGAVHEPLPMPDGRPRLWLTCPQPV